MIRANLGVGSSHMAYVQDTGVQYQTSGNRIPYNEFLQRINRATSVPIRTLHQAMCEGIGTKPLFKQEMILPILQACHRHLSAGV
ncbi:MAG: hypothetical protein IJ886_09925 [Prevotella sp.]|nr:hypothetical protein [Prevotella sp.]MBR2230563.1 hypothetical protein [Prevotella sp.]MBR3111147.1 hypothetical protein [Prevotella sp.]